MPPRDIHVVKLGGSLLDLPDLPRRVSQFLHDHATPRPLLVVGGGEAADLVREWDRRHPMTEEQGHWLAVRAMSLNAHLLAEASPDAEVVDGLEACDAVWARDRFAVVDALPWLVDEARRGIHIPHRWSFTSDSIAAHLAHHVRADRLTLLKSTIVQGASNIASMTEAGLVDVDFAAASAGIAHVQLVNLRADPPVTTTVRYA